MLGERGKIALSLAPAMLVLVGLFAGSMLLGLLGSLGYMPVLGMTELSLDAYRSVLSNVDFLRSFALSLYISLVSTILSGAIAIGAALLLRRSFVGKKAIMLLFQLNLTIPHLVGSIGILYLFSQSGVFARLAHELGAIATPGDFPALVYDPAAIGIILQYVWKEVPFIGIIVLATMQGVGENYEQVARSLGATRWQAFRHVLLPLILPGILAASMIVFAFTFGAYEIPALLAQYHPTTLPVLAYRMFTDVDLTLRPQALAMGMVIATLGATMVVAYMKISRRYLLAPR